MNSHALTHIIQQLYVFDAVNVMPRVMEEKKEKKNEDGGMFCSSDFDLFLLLNTELHVLDWRVCSAFFFSNFCMFFLSKLNNKEYIRNYVSK